MLSPVSPLFLFNTSVAETSPVSFQTTTKDPLLKRVETVGRVQPHVKAKLVDPKNGEVVEVGKPGEVVVSGYLLQKGFVLLFTFEKWD